MLLSFFKKDSTSKHETCKKIASASSPTQVGAVLNELIADYYSDVLQQARWSFICALIASVAATGFFLWAIHSTIKTASHPPATKMEQPEGVTPSEPNLSLLAGVLMHVIAGINFYLYARTSRQLASYHLCLERTNRFLLADALCDELSVDKDKRDEMRSKLIEAMFNAPMLTIAEVTGVVAKPSKGSKGNVE